VNNSAPTHALIALADGAKSHAVAQAFGARSWTADVATPAEARAALDSGRYGLAIAEFVRDDPAWREHAGSPRQPGRAPCLIAACRPEDAFFALRDAMPCAYVLHPLDASAVAESAVALARNRGPAVPLELDNGIVLDTQARRVFGPGGMWQLRPREFDLLRLLVSRRGQVISRDETIRHLYRWGEDIGSNAVDVHIHSLRRQLAHLPIRTVRGQGYLLSDDTAA
jgi:DNA-binding response OmpR family regulator